MSGATKIIIYLCEKGARNTAPSAALRYAWWEGVTNSSNGDITSTNTSGSTSSSCGSGSCSRGGSSLMDVAALPLTDTYYVTAMGGTRRASAEIGLHVLLACICVWLISNPEFS